MNIRQTFDVIVKDVNGNVLYEFRDVKPVIQAETVTISDGKFIKTQKIILECVAENAIEGVVEPSSE